MKRYLISIMMMGLLGSSVGWAMDPNPTPALLEMRKIGSCAKDKVQCLRKTYLGSCVAAVLVSGAVWTGIVHQQVRTGQFSSMLNAFCETYVGPLAFLGAFLGVFGACIPLTKWYVNCHFAAREQQVVNDLRRNPKVLKEANGWIKRLEVFKHWHHTKCLTMDAAQSCANLRENLGLSRKFNEQEHVNFCNYVRWAQIPAPGTIDGID